MTPPLTLLTTGDFTNITLVSSFVLLPVVSIFFSPVLSLYHTHYKQVLPYPLYWSGLERISSEVFSICFLFLRYSLLLAVTTNDLGSLLVYILPLTWLVPMQVFLHLILTVSPSCNGVKVLYTSSVKIFLLDFLLLC